MKEKEQTYKEKRGMMDMVIDNYKMGFITPLELICQIDNIGWNPMERIAIRRAFDDSIELTIDTFEIGVRC